MIRATDLNIGYQSTILKEIDLELENGKVYILIGRNGSGKSTLLKTISGELPALKGNIYLDSFQINAMKHSEIPHHISIVNSKFSEVDFMKVFDYIGLGRSPYTGMMGKLRDKDISKINNVITELKISHLSQRYTAELSDGEKQLVSIARSLAQDTPNIILDEPTAYLDYRNKIQTLELLKEIAIRDNKCIIISSHDIDIAIESKCPFLLIDHNEQSVILEENHQTREEILKRAF